MNYTELLTFVAPEALIVLAAFGVLAVDLITLRDSSRPARLAAAAGLTVLGCVAAMLALFIAPPVTPEDYLGGILIVGRLTLMVKFILLALTLFTALISLESDFTEHIGEYYALVLLATAGMMFLVSTEHLLMIFVSLELLSLCLYVMTAFNKRQVQSAEAALKYFLFGGMSAAVLLFGFSLLYGATGEVQLSRMAARAMGVSEDPIFLTGLLMVVAGLGFKIAAVPFHLWAPDAYEGAPLPSAAFIASGSKVASFYLLVRMMISGVGGNVGGAPVGAPLQGWVLMLVVVAALSVVVGNLAAIVQTSVRRLLAYSAVAHAGYILAGLLAGDRVHAVASVLYYVTTYALTTLGAFAVVAVVQERCGDDRLASFAGLSRREPIVAGCMLVFLLSLAGIPPLAGFFGKFYLFRSALLGPGPAQPLSLLWLVILALAMSAVSLYYYLQVLKQIFVSEGSGTGAPAAWVAGRGGTAPMMKVVLLALAGAVVLLGCFPDLLIDKLLAALGS